MLSWHQRLTSKILAVSLIFLAFLSLSLLWHYTGQKRSLVESSKREAIHVAKIIETSIFSFILKTEEGGLLIDGFINDINKHWGAEVVRMVHSESISKEYGEEDEDGKSEMPRDEKEIAALANGNFTFYEDHENFNYVLPIKSIEGCEVCHNLPDDSGDGIPVGYVLGLAVAQVSKAPMKKELSHLADESLQVLFISSVMLFIVAFFTNRHIARPLSGMLGVIRKISNGELSQRVDIKQRDEIGLLAENFNSMASQLESSFKTMENWNQQLEQEVALKTEKIQGQTTRMEEMRDYFRAIIDSTNRVIYTTDKNLIVDSVNVEWDKNNEKYGMNLDKNSIMGKNILDFISGDAKEEYSRACRDILESGGKGEKGFYRTEFEISVEGKNAFFGLTISPLTSTEGKVDGLVFVSYDINERKRAEEMLRLEKEKLDAIMNGMEAAVNIVDADHKIVYMNRIMEETFGADGVGKHCYEVIAGSSVACEMCLGGKTAEPFNLEIKASNGRTYLAIHSPVTDVDGTKSMIEVLEDISHLKEMEEKLRELTITDNLTGLFNKRHFNVILENEMARAKRQNSPLSLLFLDIDKFKSFNDTYGHVEGDVCLGKLGKIINHSLRSHVDTGYRYGGEEFTVILPGAEAKVAKRVADRIKKGFKECRFTPLVKGERVDVFKAISIGVAIFDPDKDKNIESLIERSDNAMYRAKGAGGDRVVTG